MTARCVKNVAAALLLQGRDASEAAVPYGGAETQLISTDGAELGRRDLESHRPVGAEVGDDVQDTDDRE